MLDKYIYKFLDFVMEWSGKINAWAWVKHLKYIEKRREERHFGKRKKVLINGNGLQTHEANEQSAEVETPPDRRLRDTG